MTEDQMKRTLYGLYQLDWMMSHGYSLDDLMESMNNSEVVDHNSNINDDKNGGMRANIPDIFRSWEIESGFKDSCYVCFDEFCGTWLFDRRYIMELTKTVSDVARQVNIRKAYVEWYVEWEKRKIDKEG